ncbi:sirohydrochlorin ferrochelatase [Azospirillum fermentarium]|uniref:hypothetical protein n=1 Tax=Azospirillum fermentarium TaxID=1233114 RepID=UPI0022267E16|nr:hypothetical protein [Azospirillum fermentarium]MCW2244631.1 sirohydrochlorin ferrochelatase [Azospirillum fermentarium]
MSNNQINKKEYFIILSALHQILVWIKIVSIGKCGPDANNIVSCLADLTHNLPDWVAGNDFFTVKILISDIERVLQYKFKSSYWTMIISPYICQLAALLRSTQAASERGGSVQDI